MKPVWSCALWFEPDHDWQECVLCADHYAHWLVEEVDFLDRELVYEGGLV